ncbi:MAG: glycosyltransferase family 2 protein [Flavobacteriales bacterium AspAUS03]
MNTPKVSIIVPVYNVERYLKKCLESLVQQTLSDIEIIVVNDGSIDDSQKIIDQYAISYPDLIKTFQKVNGGLGDARNYGIKHAKGEYLCFVDSDDWVDHQMFEEMYVLAKKYDTDIAVCDIYKEDETGKFLKKITQSSHLAEYIDLHKDFSVFGEMSCSACNKMFKQRLFTDLRFPVGFHFEDIATIPITFLHADKMVKLNVPYYHYIHRKGSISKSYTEKGLDALKAINTIEKQFYMSQYKAHSFEIKRFFIFQGYYGFLSYIAFIKDRKVLDKSIEKLRSFKKEKNLSILDIILYKKNNRNYFLSLPLKIQIYYLLSGLILDLLRILPTFNRK